MNKYKFNSGKFPVGNSLIQHFNKLILKELNVYCWVGGGALTSYLSGDSIKDLDLFFENRSDACKALIKLRKDFDFKLLFSTKEAIKGHIEIKGKRIGVDIIKRIFKSPIHTISEFDFTVCCLAVDSDNFYYHTNASFDILRRKLVVNNLPFPVSTTRRMAKYIKKGYSICNGTILEILTEVRRVEEQDFGIVDFYPID